MVIASPTTGAETTDALTILIPHRTHGTHRQISFDATLSVSSVSVLFYYLTRTERTDIFLLKPPFL